MERSIFAAVIGGFLGVVTLGSLAFVSSAPDSGPNSQPSAIPASPSTPPRPEGEWRLLDPVTYENISVFPVVASYGQDTSAFLDRKSTRLNSSHLGISYAVFCLKKKMET